MITSYNYIKNSQNSKDYNFQKMWPCDIFHFGIKAKIFFDKSPSLNVTKAKNGQLCNMKSVFFSFPEENFLWIFFIRRYNATVDKSDCFQN